MTQPALAFGVHKRGRHYPYPPTDPTDWPRTQWGTVKPEAIPDGIDPLPSITNVTSVVGGSGDGLLYWAEECGIRALYSAKALPLDVEVAYAQVRGSFDRARQKRADAGTRAHTLAEKLTLDAPLPEHLSDQDEAYADAFMAFVADHDPEWLEVEATVANPKVGYAGTADWFALIDGKFVVGDYKTRAKKPDPAKRKRFGLLYEKNRLQLAALAHAHMLYARDEGGWGTGALPSVDEGWGVVLFPDGTYDVEVLDKSDLEVWFDGFAGCVQAWKAIKGVAA